MAFPTKKRPAPTKPEASESPEEEAGESAEEMTSEMREGSEEPMAKGRRRKKAMKDGECSCGAKSKKDFAMGPSMKMDALTPQEYLNACAMGIQGKSRAYIRARIDAEQRLDLKCGKGAISNGEKCNKGGATKAKGPSLGVQVGQTAKGVGLMGLEAGKWASGYNMGKGVAHYTTGGKNEKGSAFGKTAGVVLSAGLLGLPAAAGAARRVGAFGQTDLQQHEKNKVKEKKWRRKVGYKDSVYAHGLKVDYSRL